MSTIEIDSKHVATLATGLIIGWMYHTADPAEQALMQDLAWGVAAAAAVSIIVGMGYMFVSMYRLSKRRRSSERM